MCWDCLLRLVREAYVDYFGLYLCGGLVCACCTAAADGGGGCCCCSVAVALVGLKSLKN